MLKTITNICQWGMKMFPFWIKQIFLSPLADSWYFNRQLTLFWWVVDEEISWFKNLVHWKTRSILVLLWDWSKLFPYSSGLAELFKTWGILVTLYFKVCLLQCNYTSKYWVILLHVLTIWLGLHACNYACTINIIVSNVMCNKDTLK